MDDICGAKASRQTLHGIFTKQCLRCFNGSRWTMMFLELDGADFGEYVEEGLHRWL